MFTPTKSTDPFDLSVLNPPRPQATSTVQRKSTLEERYLDKEGIRIRQKSPLLPQEDLPARNEDSSLGILNNISSFLAEVSQIDDNDKQEENKFDIQRETARKLLQRCSDFNFKSAVYDANKENNVNTQNLSGRVTPTNFTDSGQPYNSNRTESQNESTLHASQIKGSTTSVIFEPNEITARSSGLSRSSEKCLSTVSNKNSNAISFDSTTAELMAQFNNEEFRPASEMASQMLADEVSWQQNYSYALPTSAPAEKEYLDLSCFSGIIGELDLSVESCAGHKISVEEFFRRKCGNIGELAGDALERPSLGLSLNSPKRKEKTVPLVDSTIMTEASSIAPSVQKEKIEQTISSVAKDTEEPSIMSLTDIAQALQDIDSGTPRRLVDQLINAKKRKKSLQLQQEGAARDTYTLLSSDRKSMLATPTIPKYDPDIGILSLSSKLSLDSKKINETLNLKEKTPRMLSFQSVSDMKLKDPAFNTKEEEPSLKKEITNGSITSYNQHIDHNSHEITNTNLAPRLSFKPHTQTNQERGTINLNNEEAKLEQAIKEENISYKSKTDSIVRESISFLDSSRIKSDIIIGKSTEELCNCVVGIPRETEIELLNKGDKWITCTINVHQIQGDKQNIILSVPTDAILIKPARVERIKISVKVLKMCKPIIAVLNIMALDMVTKFEWTMKQIICFKPEELNIEVSGLSQPDYLDFQSIIANSIETAPLIIENKNSVDIPLKISIFQDRPMVFSVDEAQQKRLILKPQGKVSLDIHCRGFFYDTSDTQQTDLNFYEAKLMVQAESTIEDAIIVKEISLTVQVGICKMQVIDTELPVILSPKKSRPFSIINRGSIPITVSASFIPDNDPSKGVNDFMVEPQKVELYSGQRDTFFITYKPQTSSSEIREVKLKLSVGGNAYHYSVTGEQSVSPEPRIENIPRCETPQFLTSVSSPTSPHSVASNRSGMSGRNSPSSSVSGSTVVTDKIPIRATHAALIWNSIKAGKSDVKEFTIRNTSNNKIKIQALILDNDKSFKFLKDKQPAGSSLILVLQRTQSKTLSVVFSPHHIGAVRGKIIFRHYEPKREDNESRPSKLILLCGYGGHGKVEISEVFKDINGKIWLSLGTLSSGGPLRGKIKLQNNGDLCSFAKIKLVPKVMCPTMLSRWHVHPTELLLNSKETQWVSFEFRPRKEDISSLQSTDVSHVGTLTVVHGDEPTRLRIRRLYNKLKETEELSSSESEAFKDMAYLICTIFPGEQIISDLTTIADTVQNLGDLCQGIQQHEVMLTVEMGADETLSLLHDSVDESQMFYSLCSDNSHIYESTGDSILASESMRGPDTFQNEMTDAICLINPSVVTLNPPLRTVAVVTIRSSCKVAQSFETSLSDTEYLSVHPTEGMIPAGRDFQLRVQCKQKILRNLVAVLEIFTVNNKYDVEIRVNVKRL